MAAVASDGADHIPGIAGAVVDHGIIYSAALLGLVANSLIRSQGTGTNVGDLAVILLGLAHGGVDPAREASVDGRPV